MAPTRVPAVRPAASRVQRPLALALLAVLALTACRAQAPAYRHSRYDYWGFTSRAGRMPEPNYLPWLTHRERLAEGGDALVLCRWPDGSFPLAYHVAPPAVPEELQDEFHPRSPGEYVEAVERAFRRWEEAIGRPVRFRRVGRSEAATLRVRLRAAAREESDKRVLGSVMRVAELCRVTGRGATPEVVPIEFSARDADLYVVDAHGLLTPRQVQAVALHEIGHLLGASGQHSPLRGDVMYRIADDRRVEALSEHDVNSFRALYRAPHGAVYARLAEAHREPLGDVRRGPPRLDREVEDPRQGYRVRFPLGWQIIRSRVGWVAVDGVSWDYSASLQVKALRGELGAFVERQRALLERRGELLGAERLELDGQPVTRIVGRGDDWTEQTAVQQWGEGWLLVVVADCATRDYPLYQAWFERVLLSIEHVAAAGVGAR